MSWLPFPKDLATIFNFEQITISLTSIAITTGPRPLACLACLDCDDLASLLGPLDTKTSPKAPEKTYRGGQIAVQKSRFLAPANKIRMRALVPRECSYYIVLTKHSAWDQRFSLSIVSSFKIIFLPFHSPLMAISAWENPKSQWVIS